MVKITIEKGNEVTVKQGDLSGGFILTDIGTGFDTSMHLMGSLKAGCLPGTCFICISSVEHAIRRCPCQGRCNNPSGRVSGRNDPGVRSR